MSLQSFAIPAPRKGSLESSQGPHSAQKGIELHQRVQAEKKEEFSDYQFEVPVAARFEREEWVFEVTGRMDGFFPGSRPRIEEIKSSFNIFDLSKKIKEQRFDHSYFLQLVSYGYFYWKKEGVKPELSFEFVSSRRNERYAFEVYWSVKEYEEWLERRLNELVSEARLAEKRLKRRQKLSGNIPFPFSLPRKGQTELMSFIDKGIEEKKKMLIQAPTGMGKTIGVLYPMLKEALQRGQRVLYLTPKNSQQGVAEEAVSKFQSQGHPLKSLTITAKSKICMKAEPLCNPEYCEFARDYYDKIHLHRLKEQLAKKKKLTARVMKNLAQKYEVCPFELQMEAVADAEVVIGDYNYVFGHDSILGKISSIGFEQEGMPNLVVDEAHNLPARTMANFSPVLSTSFLEGLRKDVEGLPKAFRRDALELLDMCLGTLSDVAPEEKITQALSLSPEPFVFVNEELKSFLSFYLESDQEIKARDVVLRLVFYWGSFTEVLTSIEPSQKEFFVTVQNDGRHKQVKITCCDASSYIQDRYRYFQHHVLFSATLKPFDYYQKLSGLTAEELITGEFESPFLKSNRKVLIIPQISTKYSAREKNYPKIAEAISRIIALKKGNYLAFFPSFEFMESVTKVFQLPKETRLIKQTRFMSHAEVEVALELLKQSPQPVLLFGVLGGVFSEGIDYTGEMVIGAFVVGPPLPGFDFERERMKLYYEMEYQAGTDYAYTYPAMAKAIQAAGRVIRTEKDKGLIVLMDDRFLEKRYSETFPLDWFQSGPEELVSKSILHDVQEFWKTTDG